MTVLGIPLAFLWTALLIELTPGPNMSYLAVLSLAYLAVILDVASPSS